MSEHGAMKYVPTSLIHAFEQQTLSDFIEDPTVLPVLKRHVLIPTAHRSL
jgi:hypothetical protein